MASIDHLVFTSRDLDTGVRQIADRTGANASGMLPFVIDWGDTPSPARSAPSMGSLVALRVSHPDGEVRAAVSALDAGIVVADGSPSLTATIELPTGDTIQLS